MSDLELLVSVIAAILAATIRILLKSPRRPKAKKRH